jgi:hypothetical protein
VRRGAASSGARDDGPAAASVVVNRSSNDSTGTSTAARSASTNGRSPAPARLLAAQRQRQADDDALGPSAATSSTSSRRPGSLAARSTTASGRASVPVASEIGDAGPRGAVVERDDLHERAPRDRLLGQRDRVVERSRLLAAGASHRRPSTALPADQHRSLSNHVARVDPSALERLVEIDQELRRAVVPRARRSPQPGRAVA